MKTTTLAAFLAMVVIFIALISLNGTYALWTSRYEVSAVTISAGTADLQVSYDSGTIDGVLPGQIIEVPVIVTNSGDVDLNLDFEPGISMWVDPELSGAPCGPFDDLPVSSFLAVGESREMCLMATLDPNVPTTFQSEPMTSQMVIRGHHGTWSTTEAITLTFQIAQIAMDKPLDDSVTDFLIDSLDSEDTEIKDTDLGVSEPKADVETIVDSLVNLQNECLSDKDPLLLDVTNEAQLEPDYFEEPERVAGQITKECL